MKTDSDTKLGGIQVWTLGAPKGRDALLVDARRICDVRSDDLLFELARRGWDVKAHRPTAKTLERRAKKARKQKRTAPPASPRTDARGEGGE